MTKSLEVREDLTVHALHATATSSVRNLRRFVSEEKLARRPGPLSPLSAGTILQGRLETHTIAQQPRLCDHDAVIDAEPANGHQLLLQIVGAALVYLSSVAKT